MWQELKLRTEEYWRKDNHDGRVARIFQELLCKAVWKTGIVDNYSKGIWEVCRWHIAEESWQCSEMSLDIMLAMLKFRYRSY